MIGKTISHYKIIEKLGSGGMGDVYKAEDTKLQRTVALKFLPPGLIRDDDARQRFVHEARASSALDHPNIGTIYEIGEDDGDFFIAMAYYEGKTLKDKIEQGPLDVEEAVDTTIQILKGLTKAHSKDIIHRDIKPANILLTGDRQVKIIDFGLAKLKGSTMLTKTGTTMGTVAYMSPEQAQGGRADHRTDIWSVGVMLYEMLAGEQPFKGDYEQAIIYVILNEEPEYITKVRNDVPKQIERILERALAKDPEKRYQTMEEMLEELNNTVEDRGSQGR
jgi:serine/threonine protein kinase